MLFVLMIFVGFCFYYLKTFVVSKPHGIIVFVAPGIDTELLTLARMRSTESKFLWFGRKGSSTLSLVDSQSYRTQFADLPAILTTMATGEFSSNGYLGLNTRGQKLDNLLYAAQRSGRMVGLVTSGRLTSPGVAAFYSHVTNAKNEPEVLRSLLDSNINFIVGGGTPALKELKDSGGPDILKVAAAEGYTLANSKEQLLEIPSWITWRLKVLGVIGEDHLPTDQQRKLDPQLRNTPSLADLVASAIESLQYNIGGYFLVVEDPLIAEAAGRNQAINAADQILSLDWAIATARAYAGEKALIFVYSPYSVGGLQITGSVPTNLSNIDPQPYIPQPPDPVEPAAKKKGPPLPVAPPVVEIPSMSWHNGPGGKPPAPAVAAVPKPRSRNNRKPEPPPPVPEPPDPLILPQESAAYDLPNGALHSAGYGLLFLSGPGLEKTAGMMDVRELHDLLFKQF